jgi:CRISPR/Cas system-associated exonuclease Cas4 (RecB family)
MMSFDKQPEITEIPIAGRQIGDTNLLTPDGVVHLPDCMVFKTITNQVDPAKCSCGARFAKPGEFTPGGNAA